MGFRSRLCRAICGLAVVSLVWLAADGRAGARDDSADDSPVLHEYLPPDPDEDLRLANVTEYGQLAAALVTPAGVVRAPELGGDDDAIKGVYRASVNGAAHKSYEPDLDTRRPSVTYSGDVFSPSIAPYERLYVYDVVRADFSLGVGDRGLRPVQRAEVASQGEDSFFASFSVDLPAGRPVRIPSVAAGARLVRFAAQPSAPLQFLHDGADNWFVRSSVPVSTQLVMQLVAPRESFGGSMVDVLRPGWKRLEVPSHVHRVVWRACSVMGIDPNAGPLSVLASLVSYFRAFVPSEQPLAVEPVSSEQVYRKLIEERRGVCRHRAYAFVVTALGLGFRARMVSNEAHAWVEVLGKGGWRRLDLGGAANVIRRRTAGREQKAYPFPDDTFPWPRQGDGPATNAMAQGREQPTGMPRSSRARDGGSSESSSTIRRYVVRIRKMEPGRVIRGEKISLQGTLAEGMPRCRVLNVRLQRIVGGGSVELGTVAVGSDGRFSGEFVVPLDAEVGDYELVVGGEGCGVSGRGK